MTAFIAVGEEGLLLIALRNFFHVHLVQSHHFLEESPVCIFHL